MWENHMGCILKPCTLYIASVLFKKNYYHPPPTKQCGPELRALAQSQARLSLPLLWHYNFIATAEVSPWLWGWTPQTVDLCWVYSHRRAPHLSHGCSATSIQPVLAGCRLGLKEGEGNWLSSCIIPFLMSPLQCPLGEHSVHVLLSLCRRNPESQRHNVVCLRLDWYAQSARARGRDFSPGLHDP